jgi:alkylation response protein AidB-like acyl-CoA dehydrogenase
MDFTISEEQNSVKDLAAQILADFTSVDQLKRIEQGEECFDSKLWQALAEAGLLGVDIAQAQGGMGMDYYALSMLCEEVGRTVAPVPVVPVLAVAAGVLNRFGTYEQKERLLPGIADGSKLVTAALEEYNNDDPSRPGCSAEKNGEGYRISGTKICVSVATGAERILLSATHGEDLVVALVDPRAEGVSLNAQVVTSGETRHELILDGVEVDAADILGIQDQARASMDWARQSARAALSAMAVGLCDKMMRMTGSYTSEREQFGRAVATFQAVSHRVADCYIDTECLRLVTQQAASLIDQGQDAEEASVIAKIWCGDVSHRVSQASQHCHGGTGVDRDYPLYRYCLQARQIELSAGSSARLTGQLGRAIASSY